MRLQEIVEIACNPHIVANSKDYGKLSTLTQTLLKRALKCEIQRISGVGNELIIFLRGNLE